jgi:hypothetical protein
VICSAADERATGRGGVCGTAASYSASSIADWRFQGIFARADLWMCVLRKNSNATLSNGDLGCTDRVLWPLAFKQLPTATNPHHRKHSSRRVLRSTQPKQATLRKTMRQNNLATPMQRKVRGILLFLRVQRLTPGLPHLHPNALRNPFTRSPAVCASNVERDRATHSPHWPSARLGDSTAAGAWWNTCNSAVDEADSSACGC